MMDSCTLFDEDEVYVHTPGKGYKFGLVLENSEFASSDEEDEEDPDALKKGNIRVAWHPSGKETVVAENKVSLADRSLMPGDVVRRLVPGQDTQCGFVMDMDVCTHVRILRTNKYIYNINSKDLKPIQKFGSAQEVILGLWWGKVETVNTDIELVFPDGARCRVDENDIAGVFEDNTDKQRHGEFSMCIFYPGQELRGPMDTLVDAKWPHPTPRYCHKVAAKSTNRSYMVNCHIERIDVRCVEVHWVFGGSDGSEGVSAPPPRLVEGDLIKELKPLDWFSHCSLQIGDREFYRIKNDEAIVLDEPRKIFNPEKGFKQGQTTSDPAITTNSSEEKMAVDRPQGEDEGDFEDVDTSDDSEEEEEERKGYTCRAGKGKKKKGQLAFKRYGKSKQPQQKQTNKKPKKERIVKPDLVVEVESEFTRSLAKVMWQDGSVECDIPSVQLFPVHHLDEHQFFPGDFIMPGIEMSEQIDYGVVTSADHTERTCKIHWFRVYDAGKVTTDSKPTLVEADCEMSVYDLKDHPDYKFRPGQSVVPVGGLGREGKVQAPTVEVVEGVTSAVPDRGGEQPGGDGACQGGDAPVVQEGDIKKISASAYHTVGQVYELDPNGHLVIKWADGTISKRYPQEVFVVSDETDDDSEDNWGSEESDYESDASDNDSDASWETESEEEVDEEEEFNSKLIGFLDSKDDSGCDQGATAEQRVELDSLLARADSALQRLQKLLNDFNGTVSAPDCFHDILRIYRNCHSLDKLLKSNFFSDSELSDLISQAKAELKNDKNNKKARHLSQLFETWSRSMPANVADSRTFGVIGVDGKTYTFSPQKVQKDEGGFKITMEGEEVGQAVPVNLAGTIAEVVEGAVGGNEGIMSDSTVKECDKTKEGQQASGVSSSGGIIKESTSTQNEPGAQITSEPVTEQLATLSMQTEDAKLEPGLFGENMVAKAAKRTKSESLDESGRKAKKSRDEPEESDKLAQELCFKICKCLQKQILHVREDMSKRAKRIISNHEKENKEEKEDKPESKEPVSLVKLDPESKIDQNSESEKRQKTETGEMMLSDLEKAILDMPELRLGGISLPSNLDSEQTNCESKSSDIVMQHPPGGVSEAVKIQLEADEKIVRELKQALLSEDRELKQALLSENVPMSEADKEALNLLISPVSEADLSVSSDVSFSDIAKVPCKGFQILDGAPLCHAFITKESQPSNARIFRNAVRKEMKLFQSSLPDGIFVHGFEDRLDLFSVMILGPEGTPYEDALFFFDFMLPNDYPNAPPLCHYHSFCSDRLNPNLYEDGKVCVSLLGTWQGKGCETWSSSSTLLQVLLSIQGLILVPEPYYNEAGFERQRGTQVGLENSRMYNEMAVLKTCQSLTHICRRPPLPFKEEIFTYLAFHGPRFISRLRNWMEMGQAKKGQACVTTTSIQAKLDTELLTLDTQLSVTVDPCAVIEQPSLHSNGDASVISKDANSVKHDEIVAIKISDDISPLKQQETTTSKISEDVSPVKQEITASKLSDDMSPVKNDDTATIKISDDISPLKQEETAIIKISEDVSPVKHETTVSNLSDDMSPVKQESTTSKISEDVSPVKLETITSKISDEKSYVKPETAISAISVRDEESAANMTLDDISPLKQELVDASIISVNISPVKKEETETSKVSSIASLCESALTHPPVSDETVPDQAVDNKTVAPCVIEKVRFWESPSLVVGRVEPSNTCDKEVHEELNDSVNQPKPSVKDLVTRYESPPRKPAVISNENPANTSNPVVNTSSPPVNTSSPPVNTSSPPVSTLSPPVNISRFASPDSMSETCDSFHSAKNLILKPSSPIPEDILGNCDSSISSENNPAEVSNSENMKPQPSDSLSSNSSSVLSKSSFSAHDIGDSSANNATTLLVSGMSTSVKSPEFALFPLSKGFVITLRNHLNLYQKALDQLSAESASVGQS